MRVPTIVVGLTVALCSTAGAQTFQFNGAGAIPDATQVGPGQYGTPLVMTSASNVTDNIERVLISITMTHAAAGDLNIEITYTPTGGPAITTFFMNRVGAVTPTSFGATGNFNGTYTFVAGATPLWTSMVVLNTNENLPSGMYGTFTNFFGSPTTWNPSNFDFLWRGRSGTGSWTIRVRDGASGNTGTVQAASVHIIASPAACLADFNFDGSINVQDLTYFLAQFGKTCS